jgi:hypothetical protein
MACSLVDKWSIPNFGPVTLALRGRVTDMGGE